MKNFLALLFLTIAVIGYGQTKKLTIEKAVLGFDSESKTSLRPKSLSRIHWIPGTTDYAYFINRSTQMVTVRAGKSDTLKLETMIKSTGLKLKRIPFMKWRNSKSFLFEHQNKVYVYHTHVKQSEIILAFKPGSQNKDYNVGNNKCAVTLKNNLYIASNADKLGIVTHHASDEVVAGQAIARFEFGISKGTFWSNNGKLLAFYQKDENPVHDYPLLDMTKTPGELKSIKYPMAGQKSELAKAGVYNTNSKKLIYLETDKSGFDNEHYITNLTWDPTDAFIFVAEVNRDQNHMKLNQYDATSGAFIKTLFEEKHDKYVEPEHPPMFIPGKANEFLWFSERDGFMNLFKYNTEGELLSKVTDVNWVVKNILGMSPDGKTVVVEGTGPDARQNHAFAFDLKSGKMRQLTTVEGTHRVSVSDDCKKIIDSYSSLTIPRKIDIVDVAKGKSKNIFSAENPLDGYNYGTTEFLELKSQDGSKLYGRMIKPTDFDPAKKYPVLVYVYGGPHAQLVTNSWGAGASRWMNWMAEQGYLVFTVDGRGSANRGFKFESGIHRQLGTLEIEDQMTGVEYLKGLKYVDTERMAVHGWSFGGFMTTSLMLKKPGTFKCGVAGGPVIDWKWYEIMYGERYMDRPEQNKEGYAESGLLDKVENLKGDLLMIHGTVDDVVVMQHNLAFVKACVDKGVQIDFFPYPNHPHNVRGKDRVHLMTKVLKYVMDSLEE